MKLKYYLRGIGIGIIITTIIFMVSISIHKDDFIDKDNSENIVSESTTVAEAETLETKEETTEEASEELPHVETEVIKSDVLPESEDSETAMESEEADTKSNAPKNKDEKVRFQISGGEYSDVVCQKLVDEGLVDDAQKFNKYLIEKDLDNFILPGVYEIPKDSTYEEIAMVLTTKVEKEE